MNKLIEAVVGRAKEKTAIARIYRKNAQMRHGLPPDEDDLEIPIVQVEHSHTHEHTGLEKEREVVKDLNQSVKEETKAVEGLAKAVTILDAVTPPVVIEKDRDPRKEDGREEKPKKSDWIKKGLIAASLLGGGAGGMGLVNYFTSDPPAAESKDGSLLQYLEDRGEHLPEGFEK